MKQCFASTFYKTFNVRTISSLFFFNQLQNNFNFFVFLQNQDSHSTSLAIITQAASSLQIQSILAYNIFLTMPIKLMSFCLQIHRDIIKFGNHIFIFKVQIWLTHPYSSYHTSPDHQHSMVFQPTYFSPTTRLKTMLRAKERLIVTFIMMSPVLRKITTTQGRYFLNKQQ